MTAAHLQSINPNICNSPPPPPHSQPGPCNNWGGVKQIKDTLEVTVSFSTFEYERVWKPMLMLMLTSEARSGLYSLHANNISLKTQTSPRNTQ